MARLPDNPTLPVIPSNSDSYGRNLNFTLNKLLRDTSQQVNALAEGRIVATNNASTGTPTTGKYTQGDFIKNSQPVELGIALSKYIIIGWVCVVSGEPGTWVQCRFLTGN
jgi:hypothetical protein